MTPGVNFINILYAAFAHSDPKRVKRYWGLDWVLMLWGATGVKAAHKYVDEIDPKWPKPWINLSTSYFFRVNH